MERSKDEQHENDEGNETVQDPPQCWFEIGIINMIRFITKGPMFINKFIDYYKNSVFKVKMDETWTMVTDHSAARDVFDISNNVREPGFGFILYNTRITKTMPSMFLSGEKHDTTKKFLLNFLKTNCKDMTMISIMDLVKFEFKKISNAAHFETSIKSIESFDLESKILEAVANVFFYVVLKEYPEDPMIVYEWQNRSLKVALSCFGGSKDEEIYMKSIRLLESTKIIRYLKNDDTGIPDGSSSALDYDEKVRQILHMLFFNAIGASSRLIIASLCSIFRSTDETINMMRSDATKLCDSNVNCDEASLYGLRSFYLENVRMFPPACYYFGRATKNHHLKAKDGVSYKVKTGDIVSVSVFACQRDPNIFKNPNDFNPNRPLKDLEENIISFGGFFLDEVTTSSHKCAGAELANQIIQAFIAVMLKCEMVPEEIPPIYNPKIGRNGMTTNPVKVKSFRYQEIE